MSRIPVIFEAASPTSFRARAAGYEAFAGPGGVDIQTRGKDAFRLEFAGAGADSRPRPETKPTAKVNYLAGSGPAVTLDAYERLRFASVYPGIDAVLHGNQRQIEYDFHVAPGSDWQRIELRFTGASRIALNPDGELEVALLASTMRQRRPRAYQVFAGAERDVEVAYELRGGNRAGFRVGAYDPERELIIDPVISTATYLGGSSSDRAFAIAADASGNAYIAGDTASANFPRVGGLAAFQGGSSDVFVTKLNAAGTGIVYSTFIGGSDLDTARALALDSAGNVLVTGYTRSNNFPVTPGAYQRTNAGQEDAFVLKLDASGQTLLYSTYIGGSGSDQANALAVNSAGEAFVTGMTSSTRFPVTSGALQQAYRGGNEAFVVRVNASGSGLVYSTYLGGTNNENGAGIAVDSSGNAYVTGTTQSTDFPVFAPLQSLLKGNTNGFVTKLNPAGTALVYSTYFGGRLAETVNAITMDSTGSAVIAGSTSSIDFPVTADALQAVLSGTYDAFVARLNPQGSQLLNSTLLGGAALEEATAVSLDSQGRAYIAGYTSSANWPVANATQTAFGGFRDGFVALIAFGGSSMNLLYSTYLGGSAEDRAQTVAVGPANTLYVAGYTVSTDLPVTAPLQGTAGGSTDAFFAKATIFTPPTATSVSPASGSGGAQSFTANFSSPLGASNLVTVHAQFALASNSAVYCRVAYWPQTRNVLLYSTASSSWLGPVVAGTAGTLDNGICSVNPASVTAISLTAGNALSVVFPMTFRPGMTGSLIVSGMASDSSGLSSPWAQWGTWTVPAVSAGPPTVVSVSPASGSGNSQTFSLTYSSSSGATALTNLYGQFVSTANGALSCQVLYLTQTQQLYLFNASTGSWVGPGTAGTTGTLDNGLCVVNTGGARATASGNSVTLALPFTFKSGIYGSLSNLAFALDNAGRSSGWVTVGSWTATAPVVAPPPPPGNPTVSSVSPASGSGNSQSFTFTYGSPSGAAALSSLYAQFVTTGTASAGCQILYSAQSRQIYIYNIASASWAGPAMAGTSGTLENGPCALNTGNSVATASGNSVALALPMTFKSGIFGNVSTMAIAVDNANLNSGWVTLGSWTATAPVAAPPPSGPPAVVSVNPASGAGASQPFTFTYSSPFGAAALTNIYAQFLSAANGSLNCQVLFSTQSRLLYLYNPATTWWAGPIAAGAAGSLDNGLCTINTAGVTAVANGNSYTLTLPFAFRSTIFGSMSTLGFAVDNAGLNSGWVPLGTWTAR